MNKDTITHKHKFLIFDMIDGHFSKIRITVCIWNRNKDGLF